MIYIVLISLVIGLFIGYNSPIVIPLAYSKLFSVALVAAICSKTIGAERAEREKKLKIFLRYGNISSFMVK